jgi:hypothetical protein
MHQLCRREYAFVNITKQRMRQNLKDAELGLLEYFDVTDSSRELVSFHLHIF